MSARKDTRPDVVLRDVGAGGTRATVDRLVAVINAATSAQRVAGVRWYPVAEIHARAIATLTGTDLGTGAAVIAELSPRCDWTTNVRAAHRVARGQATTGLAVLPRNLERARAVLAGGTPTASPKVSAFRANVAGDPDAVTVDVWAARAAGVPEELLGRVGVYGAVAHAYRLAAARTGLTPREAQAVAWVVVRSRPRVRAVA